MDLRQLKYFLQIAKCGSFSQASKVLFISQPALTRSVNLLEDMLRVRLFERTHRGVNLTPAGEILFKHAELVVNQLEAAEAELEFAHEGVIGEVKIGVANLVTNVVLGQAIPEFTECSDKVRVSIIVGMYEELTEQLESGLLDFVVSTNPNTESDLDFEPLLDVSSDIVAAPSHPIFEIENPRLEDLLKCDWVMLEEPGMDSFMHVFFATANLPSPRSTVSTQSLELLRSLIGAGRYIGFLPSHWTYLDVRVNRLKVVDVPSTPIERKIGIVTRPTVALSAAALGLMESIRRASVDWRGFESNRAREIGILEGTESSEIQTKNPQPDG